MAKKTQMELGRILLSRVYRVFILIVGLAVLFLFYKGVAHADAVYSFTKTVGGTDQDYGRSVAVDSSGNVYTTGYFRDTVDFDPGAGTDSKTSVGVEDIFLTKINSDGSYGWTKTLGGTDQDYGQSVAVDGSDNVYLAGYFRDTVDFDPDAGTDNHTSAGQEDIFITKINSDGSYGWTKTLGGTDQDYGQSVAVDGSDNVYLAGYFRDTVDFDPGAGTDNRTSAGQEDIFIMKINSSGSVVWTRTLGGTDQDYGRSVAVDGSDNVYLAGYFRGTVDFDPGAGTDNHISAGVEDIFLTKIESDGSYAWTKTLGGTDQDYGRSVAVDGSDDVYLAGYFRGTADFDPGAETDDHTSAGVEDIFLTKIESDGSYGWTKTLGGTDQDVGQSVAVDGSDNVYITGYFQGTADFDPGTGVDNHTSAGLDDIFLTKINFDGSYDLTKTIGGTDQDVGQSIVVDDSVNAYLTGYFSDTVDFDPGTGTDNHTSVALEDIYLTKFRWVDFVIIPTSVTTTGGGGTATFTVRLLSEPSANVTLPVSSSNTSLGTVDTSSLTFTNINWSVDQTVTVTSVAGSSQNYSILLGAASSADTDYNGLNPTDVTVVIEGNDSGSGSCFIATAAYGSPLASHIKILSKFRDHFLLTNRIGRYFVRFYYTCSPPVADFIKKHDNLRMMVRLSLLPIVGASWLVLKIGLVFTMMITLFFGIGLIGLVKFIGSKKSFQDDQAKAKRKT